MFAPLFLVAVVAAPATAVTLADDVVRVGDAAIVGTGRSLPILRLPRGTDAVTLTPDALHTLVANRIPGTRFTLRRTAPVRFVRGAGATAAPSAAPCLRTRVAVPAGGWVAADMVERIGCGGAPLRIGYDRTVRAAVARREIPAGANLGRVRAVAGAPVAAGQALLLRTRTGPVVVERRVVALQPAPAGARLFARTDDGVAISSRLAATAPESLR